MAILGVCLHLALDPRLDPVPVSSILIGWRVHEPEELQNSSLLVIKYGLKNAFQAAEDCLALGPSVGEEGLQSALVPGPQRGRTLEDRREVPADGLADAVSISNTELGRLVVH